MIRKRFLYVAIDRCSRWVHLAVFDDELTASAIAFLKEAIAPPFGITHLLTDRGSCFTAKGFEAACRTLKVQHRKTRPYTPQTNGLVERFNGRVQREVLGITVHSHAHLETLLKGFNQAYNRRRQRVLKAPRPSRSSNGDWLPGPSLRTRASSRPIPTPSPGSPGRGRRQRGLTTRHLTLGCGRYSTIKESAARITTCPASSLTLTMKVR